MIVTAHCQGVSQTVQLHPRVCICEGATPHVPSAKSTLKAGAGRLSEVPKPRRHGRTRGGADWGLGFGEAQEDPWRHLKKLGFRGSVTPVLLKALLTHLQSPCVLGPMCLCSCAISVSPGQTALKHLLTGSLGRA